VIITVWIQEFRLDEDRRVLTVGDDVSFWLYLEEAARSTLPAERVQTIRGVAQPLPIGPGDEPGRHLVQVSVGDGVLYWSAPGPVEGPVEIAGSVYADDPEDPDDMAATRGVIRRIRMERRDFVQHRPRQWRLADARARYEDVSASYFPYDAESDPAAESTLIRKAREHRAAQSDARAAGASFFIGFPPERRDVPLGTVKTRWTGVLIDLEITCLDQS
jgi:hypothetical protein